MIAGLNARSQGPLCGLNHPKRRIIGLDFEALSETLIGGGLYGHLLHVGDCPYQAFPIGMRDAFLEFRQNTGAPDAVITIELLTFMAAGLQLYFRVQTLDDSIDIMSLFGIVASETGSGKSPIDKRLSRVIEIYLSVLTEKFKDEMRAYNREHRKWRAKQKGTSLRLSDLARRGLQEDDHELAAAEVALDEMADEPVKPVEPDILQTGGSIDDILYVMSLGEKSILLISDEGEALLKGTIKDDQPDLNRVFDGRPINRGRKNRKIRIEQPIMSMSVATYPKALGKFVDKYGEDAIERGFLGRCFFAIVEKGELKLATPGTVQSWANVDIFCNTLARMFTEHDAPARTKDFTPKVLHLSSEAKEGLAQWMRNIQPLIELDGLWRSVGLLAKKSPQLITRVAGTFHVYDGNAEMEISADTVKRAIQVVEWFLAHAARVFMVKPLAKKLNKIDDILRAWCAAHFDPVAGVHHDGWTLVPKNHVLQNSRIPAEELEPLLHFLREQKYFRRWTSRTGKKYLDLDTHHFP
jgi:hypothetical protein